jgi:hypothetical protein
MVSRSISGSGLRIAKVSAPQIAAKRGGERELVEEQSKAIRACWCTPPDAAVGGERVERRFQAGKRARAVGDVRRIELEIFA